MLDLKKSPYFRRLRYCKVTTYTLVFVILFKTPPHRLLPRLWHGVVNVTLLLPVYCIIQFSYSTNKLTST
jgi:hypothetical protein